MRLPFAFGEIQLELFPEAPLAPPPALRASAREAKPACEAPPIFAPAEPTEFDALAAALADHAALSGRPAPRLTYTRSQGAILGQRPARAGRPAELRVHKAFREAPALVAEAVVRLTQEALRRNEQRELSRLLLHWHLNHSTPEPLTSARYRPGTVHALEPLLEDINDGWFDGALDLAIGYAPRIGRRLMGRHERRAPRNLILINPLLDRADVELWYLNFLVYHECLHELIPPRYERGRLMVHPPEFREREREHPDWPKVRPYERWLSDELWPKVSGPPKRRSRASG